MNDFSARDELVAAIPSLRAFAITLCGRTDQADDLVQETLVKAWGNIDSYTPGTNLRAWLFTILRNGFYSHLRKRRREVEDVDGAYSASLSMEASQSDHIRMREFRAALAQLPADQREALILVGAAGHSYEETAEICGCAVGTIKSRVNRARRRLATLLDEDESGDGEPITVATVEELAASFSLAAFR